MTESKSQFFGSPKQLSEKEQQIKIRKKVQEKGFIGYEIYGIGGLGAKTAAHLWAKCALNEKNIRLSSWFLSGTERRGTEVLMKGTITTKQNTNRLGYEPEKKDLLVFFSENTIQTDHKKYQETGQSLFSKANPGATVIINSEKDAEKLVKEYPHLGSFDIFAVNANAKIPNMQMLAATITATGIGNYQNLKKRIKNKFHTKAPAIFEQIKKSTITSQPQTHNYQPDFNCVKTNRNWVPDGAYAYPDWGSSGGSHMVKGMKQGINYYIDMESCNRCQRCYDVCPENAIRGFWPETKTKQAPGALKNSGGEGFLIIEEYCKSCGLCESVCNFKEAIKTEASSK